MFSKTDKPSRKPKTARDRDNEAAVASVPSIISDDMNVLGNIISDGYVDINGRVEGNIRCHSINVRERGYIKGDVIADSVDVHGKINGLIKTRQIHLHGTAHITGIIMHESMSVDDGAFIDGQCKRTDKSASASEKLIAADASSVTETIRLISDNKLEKQY